MRRHDDDDCRDAAHVGIIEIEAREIGELFLGGALFDELASPPPHPDRDLDEAEDEDHRQDNVREEADVGIVEPAPQLGAQEDDDQETRNGGQDESGNGEGVVGVVEDSTEELLAIIRSRCHGSPGGEL